MAPLIVAEIVIEKDMKRKRMASKDEMDLEVEERIITKKSGNLDSKEPSIHQFTAQSHVGEESPDEDYKSCNDDDEDDK